MKKILFTGDTLSNEARNEYKEQGFDIIPAKNDLEEDEVASLLQECDGYILGGDEIASKGLIEKAGTKLKAISFFGAGYEKYVDVSFAKSKGILVSNTPGANSDSVAEFTVALLLTATKNIVNFCVETKKGNWNRPKTMDISNKTVGIIGMGNVGKKVSRILRNGFNMKVIYCSNWDKKELDIEIGSKRVELGLLLKESDVILIHASFNDNTNKLLSTEEFEQMKDGVIIINTARAEIVDEAALNEAIISNKVQRAAFDVFYEEPINLDIVQNHGLLKLDNEKFIISPHMAYYTFDAIQKMEKMAINNICEMLSSEKCTNIVND